ncbi:hypothetical protein A2480_04530 [Candidatus Uhrbacteria bacterium RIFOXYC2_FULL_47_19]|uniref:PABS domain-containing protein n=1 Tax=Candidatus Uhrbacteria bacterium RIFOXYC2_FULL_47_19 TaxID=1802424 RepID=A0A1F7WCS6_9BACT|nr:MAG: hypothetical protein A2480_04530 [Candidatus Uhrbacteria bacterium RIFOXYC2_FULL_47_19]HCC22332.1 hypothetical protein [Candidatus Uhrbacteria bacterium]
MKHLIDSRFFLAVCSFIVGAAVMTIEMTASRVLAPYFGASLFVWTALIVTVLASMSVGYWLGGRLARRYGEGLGILFCGASISLMLGMFAVQSTSNLLSVVLHHMDMAAAALFLGSLLLSFIVFSVPVFLLAMAGPIIISRWLAISDDVGGTTGRYFSLSTIGSVIGTIAPSLFLVPEFGVKTTMILVATILGVLGLLALTGFLRWLSLVLVIVGILSVVVQTRIVSIEVVYERETPYQLVRVEERAGRRYLIFNEGSGVQSVYFPDDVRTDLYFDHLAAIPFLGGGNGDGLEVAVLGLAGGAAVRQMISVLPSGVEMNIVGVELDSNVIDVARDWFGLNELPVKVVRSDGRAFFDTDQKYDLILADAYSTQLYIPPHMATSDFFALVRSRLNEGGLLVMNVNAAERNSRLLLAITNTLASVFPEVHLSKVGRSWNWLVVSGDQAPDYANAMSYLPDGYSDVIEALAAAQQITYSPAGELLTDDRAPIELMTEKMVFAEALLGRD